MADRQIGSRYGRWLAACGVELSFLFLAWVLARLWKLPLMADLDWSVAGALYGLAATAPLFALLGWLQMSRLKFCRELRQTMDELVRPIFAGWGNWQLLVLAICAGVAEEALFRGVLLRGGVETLGVPLALVGSSLLFGAFHPITTGYLFLTALIGFYLGGLMLLTESLLAVMVCHAVYDFVALLWFLRWRRGEE